MNIPKINNKFKIPSLPFDEILNYIKEGKLKEVEKKIDEALKNFHATDFSRRSQKIHQFSRIVFTLNRERENFVKMIDDIEDESYRTLARTRLASTIKKYFDEPIAEMRKNKEKHSLPE